MLPLKRFRHQIPALKQASKLPHLRFTLLEHRLGSSIDEHAEILQRNTEYAILHEKRTASIEKALYVQYWFSIIRNTKMYRRWSVGHMYCQATSKASPMYHELYRGLF